MSFMDELRFYSIHEEDYKASCPVVKAFLSQHEEIWYPQGLKNGKSFDKLAEIKELLVKLEETRHKYNQEESNVEGMILDQITDLIKRLDIQEFRELVIKVMV